MTDQTLDMAENTHTVFHIITTLNNKSSRSSYQSVMGGGLGSFGFQRSDLQFAIN